MSDYTFSTRSRPEPITEPNSVVKGVGNKGITTTISAIDEELFDIYNYAAGKTGYVISDGQRKDSPNEVTHSLHRKIIERAGIEVPDGQCVDHKDQNKLNNVRSNLRVVTRPINSMNCSDCWRENTPGYRGVTEEPVGRRFMATVGGRNMGQDTDARIAKKHRVEGVRRFVGEDAAEVETEPDCTEEEW